MKKLCIGLIVISVLFFALPSFALGPLYIGANYTGVLVSADDAGAADALNMEVLMLNAGYYLIDFLAVEGRAGFGISDDSDGANISGEVNYIYGLYLRGELPLGMFKPYVMAGYSKTEFAYNDGDSQKEDDTGFSYGLGLDLQFGDHFGINGEYMRLMEFDNDLGTTTNINIDTVSLGLKIYF